MCGRLIRGEIAPDESLATHLNHCLLCRACEKACPSEVPFGAIMDEARSHLPRPTGAARLTEWIAPHRGTTRMMADLSSLLYRTGLPLPSLPKAAATLMRRTDTQLLEQYPAVGKLVGRIGLFLGCFAAPFDRQTHHSATVLLTRLGYEVVIPKAQRCCGALALHHGNPAQTDQLTAINQQAFDGLDAVVFTSTGCGQQLTEQGSFNTPCYEISDFILNHSKVSRLHFRLLQQTTLLHHPCTLRNVLDGTHTVEQLLQLIPKLQISILGPDQSCCGAAGSHRLREPVIADRLRQPKIEAIRQSGAQILLSTNFGCALHLTEGAQKERFDIEILHPVTLLSRQLDESGNSR